MNGSNNTEPLLNIPAKYFPQFFLLNAQVVQFYLTINVLCTLYGTILVSG